MPQKDTLYGDLFVIGNLEANLIKKTGGTSSQFLKADGSVDSSTYLSSVPTLAQVTTAGNTTTNAITVGGLTTSGQVLFNAFGAYNTGTPTLRIENVDTNNVAIQIKGNVANYKYYWIYDSVKGEGIYKSDQGRIDLIGGTSVGLGFVNNYGRLFTIGGSTGNVLIGTTTDAGYKLDVNGTARVQGKLTVSTGGIEITGASLFSSNLSTNATGAYFNASFFNGKDNFYGGGNTSLTSGYTYVFQAERNFLPSSGTATYTAFYINSTINQTGGANGITRGIHINPTLTAAADFRAIETTVGKVIFGSTSGNVLIGTTTDSGQKLQISGSIFIKGTTSLTATKIFEVQNGSGTSIMDFRDNQYAFFGCGQGGGSASGFIFNYSNTSYTQFSGYNYGAGSGSYKPILMDTDGGGRNQGIFVNFGVSTNTPPNSDTEFAVRGRTSDSSTYISKFVDSSNVERFSIRADGALFVGGSQGYTGTVNFPTNPPGQQNIDIVNGMIVNVF